MNQERNSFSRPKEDSNDNLSSQRTGNGSNKHLAVVAQNITPRFQQFQDHSSFKRARKRSSISNKSKISIKDSDKNRRGSRIAEIFRSDKHILNGSKDNSNFDSKAIDQVYDMIDHAKVIRIYS